MSTLFGIFVSPFIAIKKNFRMLKQTAFNDIKAKYVASVLGLVWMFLYPLMFLGAYALVYIYVFQVRFELYDTKDYILLIFSGLVPFLGFNESISTGTGCVVSNAALMKNTMFPVELIPVKTIITCQTTQLAGFVMLTPALGLGHKITIFFPLLLLMWILQFMLEVGLVWILSALNVFFRDLQNIIAVILLLLMMLSPIAYPVEMVPDAIKPFLKVNPAYYFISGYQDVLFNGRFPNLSLFVPFAIMSIVFFLVGYFFFMRAKNVFVDNI